MSDLLHGRKLNFSAGPAALPVEVLEQAQDELLNYHGTGVSVMEMSHRTPEFEGILNEAVANVKSLLNVPDNYKILFMQGGGTGQFAAVAMNLMALKPGMTADYFVTGSWSQKAAEEATKYGKVNYVLPQTKVFNGVPDKSVWQFSNDASYIFYCANETIHGIEFQDIPDHNSDVPLVCDMSSNILSKHVDVSKFGVIFFGAQKNVGPAGVVAVIIREDLIGHAMKITPTIFDYKDTAKNNSLHHTPPCYSIYICGLVFKWIKANGGVEAMEDLANQKAAAIYDVINNSNGFYYCAIDKEHRSRMNITFRVGGKEGNEALEKEFLAESHKLHMTQLKGHRSVGGLRASLYNAVTVENAQALAKLMQDFQARKATEQ